MAKLSSAQLTEKNQLKPETKGIPMAEKMGQEKPKSSQRLEIASLKKSQEKFDKIDFSKLKAGRM